MILEYQLPAVSGNFDQERISCCYLYYVSNFAEFLKDRSKRGQSDTAGGRKGGWTESLLRHDPWMPPDVLPVGGVGCITDKVVVRLRALASHLYIFSFLQEIHIEHLLHARNRARLSGSSSKQEGPGLQLCGTYRLTGETYNRQVDK